MTARLANAGAALLLALGLATATLASVRQPLSLGDYAAIWGLKARALHATGEIASVFRVDPEGSSSHPEYPPLWPLLLAGTSRLLGRFDELWLTLWRPLLLLLASASAFRAVAAPLPYRLWAAAAVALLPYWRSPLTAGYAEGLLVALLLAAAAEADSIDRGWRPAARFAGLLALAALTKQEGALAGLLAGGVLLASGRRRLGLLTLGVLLGAALGPWAAVRAAFDTSRPLADFALPAFALGKLAAAAAAFGRGALPVAAPWVAGFALLLALAPGTVLRRRGLLAVCGLYLAALSAAFAFTTRDPAWLVTWTWDRLAFVPAALLLPVSAEAFAEAISDAADRSGTGTGTA